MGLALTLESLIEELDLPHPGAEAVAACAARWGLHAGSPRQSEQIPRVVRAALEAAADLGGAAGLEALLDAAEDGSVGEGACAVVAAAFSTPDLVVDAARALGRCRWPVWELAGREPEKAAVRWAEVGARLEAALRPGLEARRHQDVSVGVQERGPEVRVRISSSGPPLRGRGGDVRLLVADLVVVDWRRGRLRLAVESGWRRALYVGALGQALRGDPAWFGGPTVTLAPIMESPEAALRPTLTVGCARLVGVEMGGDGPGDVLTLSGTRVWDRLARLDLLDQLDRLQAVTLDLQIDIREARVEVRPPHLIVYDRPREEPAVRAFLTERGLLGGSPRT